MSVKDYAILHRILRWVFCTSLTGLVDICPADKIQRSGQNQQLRSFLLATTDSDLNSFIWVCPSRLKAQQKLPTYITGKGGCSDEYRLKQAAAGLSRLGSAENDHLPWAKSDVLPALAWGSPAYNTAYSPVGSTGCEIEFLAEIPIELN